MADQVVISQGPTAPADNQNQNTNQPQDQRPAWLPEKFKSPEDMAKAYGELEKQFTKSRQNAQPPANNQLTQQGDKVMLGQMDVTKYSNEFQTTGGLSEESYAELEKMGIPRHVTDAYIHGQTSLAERAISEVKGVVGGEENYDTMINWAKANLSPTEQMAFNNAVNGQDIEQVKLAVAGLWSKYTAVNGNPPKSLLAGGGAVTGGQGFRSSDEMIRAMSDPRYRTDEAYRKDVSERVMRSTF